VPVRFARRVWSVVHALRAESSARRGRHGSLEAGLVAALALAACVLGCSDRQARERAVAAAPRTVVYSVEGMHCANCVEAITATAKEIPGVTACEVSLERKEATVVMIDPSAKAKVAEAVGRLGYTIAPRP
jgi:copper chaperone CopZ